MYLQLPTICSRLFVILDVELVAENLDGSLFRCLQFGFLGDLVSGLSIWG